MGVTAVEGHRFANLGPDGTGHVTSPYPGWDYGISLLVATAAIIGATEGVLRLIARRPAVIGADPAYDAASRRLSAYRVLRGTQFVLALTLSIILVVGGSAIVNAQRMEVGAPLVALGYVVATTGIILALIPAPPPTHPAAHPAATRHAPSPASAEDPA